MRKERECEVKTKEKEEVMRTVTMLKGKYEGEVERRKKAEVELKDAELQKEKLQYNVSLYRWCANAVLLNLFLVAKPFSKVQLFRGTPIFNFT